MASPWKVDSFFGHLMTPSTAFYEHTQSRKANRTYEYSHPCLDIWRQPQKRQQLGSRRRLKKIRPPHHMMLARAGTFLWIEGWTFRQASHPRLTWLALLCCAHTHTRLFVSVCLPRTRHELQTFSSSAGMPHSLSQGGIAMTHVHHPNDPNLPGNVYTHL